MKYLEWIIIIYLVIMIVYAIYMHFDEKVASNTPSDAIETALAPRFDSTAPLMPPGMAGPRYFFMENFEDGAAAQKEIIPSNGDVPDLEFPFKNIRDEKGQKLNIVAISAPFREKAHEEKYAAYKNAGLNILGISSYLEFPNEIHNPFEDQFHKERKHDYVSMASSWLYCHRDPGYKIQYSGIPTMLMTEADLKNPDHYQKDPAIKPEYDFIYICLDDHDKGTEGECKPGWNWYIRSWDLAKRCLEVMCEKFHLKGVIVGRSNCEFTEKCNGIVKTIPFLEYHNFQKELQKCRFLFAPNGSDASPRVIVEAMLYDKPVLVNYNIVGGWHNVISGVTGETFTSEYDVEMAIQKILSNYDKYTPRKWYTENRGIHHSGQKLAKFLKETYPNLNHPDLVHAYI